jgi:hypothetical protein
MQAKHKAHREERVTMLRALTPASLQGLETYLSILVAMVTVKVPSVSGR